MNSSKLDFDERIAHYTGFLMTGYWILPAISFAEGKKIAGYLSNWAKFEMRYYKLIKKPLVYKIRNLQYVFIIYLIVCSTLFFLTMVFMLLEKRNDNKIKISTFVMALVLFSNSYYFTLLNSSLGVWIFLNLGIRKATKILLQDLKVLNWFSFKLRFIYVLIFLG